MFCGVARSYDVKMRRVDIVVCEMEWSSLYRCLLSIIDICLYLSFSWMVGLLTSCAVLFISRSWVMHPSFAKRCGEVHISLQRCWRFNGEVCSGAYFVDYKCRRLLLCGSLLEAEWCRHWLCSSVHCTAERCKHHLVCFIFNTLSVKHIIWSGIVCVITVVYK